MKNLIILIIIALAISSCNTKYSGTADVEGYLMYECGSNDPLGGSQISFIISGETLFTTKTNADGYFRLYGDYSTKVRPGMAFDRYVALEGNGQNGGGFFVKKIMTQIPDKVHDTIYYHNKTFSILRIETSQPSFGSKGDTLFISYANKIEGMVKKYYGPFTKGQILDTLETAASQHVGYSAGLEFSEGACSYFINNFNEWNAANKPNIGYYPFVRGQRNIACGQYTNVYIKLD